MNAEYNWSRFILSGRVEDYLKFVDSCRTDFINRGEDGEYHNRCVGNKRDKYRGKRPPYNPYDT